jgi:hypothetical protein
MTFLEMQTELLAILQDAGTVAVGVPDRINEAVQGIAEDVKFPELRQVSSVVTSISTYYVNMPTGFSSRLKYCGDSDGEYKILDTLEDLIRLYPALDETGDIAYVACEGGILYYQPIPTVAKTLTCVGYHVPALLVDDGDTPSFIPSYLHREAIVNAAAVGAYSIIEDGMEGDKINTKVFAALAENGLNKVRAYVSRRRPVVSTSNWRV